jgi:CBS domain-containing protein
MQKIESLMTPAPVCVPPEISLDEAMSLMDEKDIRHLPVVQGRELVGVVSDRDLLELTGWLSKRQREVLDLPAGPVGEHTNKSPVTVQPEDGVELALDLVLGERIGCLPVTVDGALVGLVTEMDLLATYVTASITDRDARVPDPLVAQCMTHPARTIAPGSPAQEAAELFVSHTIRHLPVMDGERLVGMLSDRDLRLEVGRGGIEGLTVEDLMTRDPLLTAHDAQLSTAADRMIRAKIGAIPVLENTQLVGILCLSDVLNAWLAALRKT